MEKIRTELSLAFERWNFLNSISAYLIMTDGFDVENSCWNIKKQPRGHWGVCPPLNCVLSALSCMPFETDILIGPGHAGASVTAFTWATGRLEQLRPQFRTDIHGLNLLCQQFPYSDGIGGESHPVFSSICYLGGQLGPALPVAQGASLMQGPPLFVIIGDGESETGAVSASWLGDFEVRKFRKRKLVVIVLANGQRMGSESLLSRVGSEAFFASAVALDWGFFQSGPDPIKFGMLCNQAINSPKSSSIIVLDVIKGSGLPLESGLLGTPRVHKVPFPDPYINSTEHSIVKKWLNSYSNAHSISSDRDALFSDGCAGPRGLVVSHETLTCVSDPEINLDLSALLNDNLNSEKLLSFGDSIVDMLCSVDTDIHPVFVFSPDEASSNKVSGLLNTSLPLLEILNEELCFYWAQGLLEAGGAPILISYEAFSTIFASGISSLLKARDLYRRESLSLKRPLVILLTSLGWKNCFSHRNPGLQSLLHCFNHSKVKVFMPPSSIAAVKLLQLGFFSDADVWVVVADKHNYNPNWPSTETLTCDIRLGVSIIEKVDSEIVLISHGDIAAELSCLATKIVKEYGLDVEQRHITDLDKIPDNWVSKDRYLFAITSGFFEPFYGRLCSAGLLPLKVFSFTDPVDVGTFESLKFLCGCSAEQIANELIFYYKSRM